VAVATAARLTAQNGQWHARTVVVRIVKHAKTSALQVALGHGGKQAARVHADCAGRSIWDPSADKLWPASEGPDIDEQPTSHQQALDCRRGRPLLLRDRRRRRRVHTSRRREGFRPWRRLHSGCTAAHLASTVWQQRRLGASALMLTLTCWRSSTETGVLNKT
jgi:hypothetical protein